MVYSVLCLSTLAQYTLDRDETFTKPACDNAQSMPML